MYYLLLCVINHVLSCVLTCVFCVLPYLYIFKFYLTLHVVIYGLDCLSCSLPFSQMFLGFFAQVILRTFPSIYLAPVPVRCLLASTLCVGLGHAMHYTSFTHPFIRR